MVCLAIFQKVGLDAVLNDNILTAGCKCWWCCYYYRCLL